MEIQSCLSINAVAIKKFLDSHSNVPIVEFGKLLYLYIEQLKLMKDAYDNTQQAQYISEYLISLLEDTSREEKEKKEISEREKIEHG